MIEKLHKINEILVNAVADIINTALAIVGFLALYPLLFVAIISSLGSFFWQRDYLWGLIYLTIAMVAYYTGKGIERYLKNNKAD